MTAPCPCKSVPCKTPLAVKEIDMGRKIFNESLHFLIGTYDKTMFADEVGTWMSIGKCVLVDYFFFCVRIGRNPTSKNFVLATQCLKIFSEGALSRGNIRHPCLARLRLGLAHQSLLYIRKAF